MTLFPYTTLFRSKPKNSIFATFPRISPLSLSPTKPQFFHHFRGLLRLRNSHSSSLTNSPAFPLSERIASQPTFPIIFSHISPTSTPFRGMALGRFWRKSRGILSKYSRFFNKFLLFWRCIWGRFEGTPGEPLGKIWGQCQGISSPFLRRNPP